MRDNFKKMAEKLNLEIHEIGNKKMYGLKWGEGRVAEIMGFKRKDVIKALDWADEHNEEAEQVLKEVYNL